MESKPTQAERDAELALIEYLGAEEYIRTLKYLVSRPCGVETDS